MSDAPLQPPPVALERAQPGFWASVRGSLAGEENDYTSERLPRSILLLAVPMVLEMLMESTYSPFPRNTASHWSKAGGSSSIVP